MGSMATGVRCRQVSPLRASSNDVGNIDIVIKKKPGGAVVVARADDNGAFTFNITEPGTYQLLLPGGPEVTSPSPGTKVTASFSIKPSKVTPGLSAARTLAPPIRTATDVVNAKGVLTFPGDIMVTEPSVLSGRLRIVQMPVDPAKPGPAAAVPAGTAVPYAH